MPQFLIFISGVIMLVGVESVFAQAVLTNPAISEITLSPDHRYGMTVPTIGEDEADSQNKIVEIATNRVIGTIQGDVAWAHMNHDELVPTLWNSDDSIVLWQVDGKWGFSTEILIKLEQGKIKWQIDVLKLIRQEILKRTQEAVPKKYALVKKEGKDDGSWWQDGFAIDSVMQQQNGIMKFPLHFNVFLTSNPKNLEGETNIDARMTVEVNQDGAIKVGDFHLGKTPPSRNWD